MGSIHNSPKLRRNMSVLSPSDAGARGGLDHREDQTPLRGSPEHDQNGFPVGPRGEGCVHEIPLSTRSRVEVFVRSASHWIANVAVGRESSSGIASLCSGSLWGMLLALEDSSLRAECAREDLGTGYGAKYPSYPRVSSPGRGRRVNRRRSVGKSSWRRPMHLDRAVPAEESFARIVQRLGQGQVLSGPAFPFPCKAWAG